MTSRGSHAAPARFVRAVVACGLLVVASVARASEPAACRTVRLAEVAWTDNTAVTALAAVLLEALGYTPHVQVVSVPVAFGGMRNGDLDVFLGAWMPSMTADLAPYLADASVEQIAVNLDGARYTLAVPDYVHAAGVRSFADLAAFGDRFDRRIYGLEPGNDGNRLLLTMIERDAFGLAGWRLVASSEQGMLAQVARATAAREWIVFLGWEPHPMNLHHRLVYLAGGDAWFGADGGAAVWTTARRGFADACPNVARLLRNLRFSVAIENALMDAVLARGMAPRDAARQWLLDHPHELTVWLRDVTTIAGEPGLATVTARLRRTDGSAVLPRLPLGRWVEQAVSLFTSRFGDRVRAFADALEAFLERVIALALRVPPLLAIGLLCVASFAVQRSWRLALLVATGLLLILDLGYWRPTIETATLVLFSSGFSISIGVPTGIAAAHRPWLYAVLRPVLDLMQTIPTFVYLIPALVLFGLGMVPGIVATIVFALPAPIRLTYVGVRGVPAPLREAGIAFGATPFTLLTKIELPYARAAILAGATECIMLCLSMVVIAALVGAEGLGEPVVRALNTVDVARGFEAGLAIVVLAILLDRVLRHGTRRRAGRGA